MLVFGEWSLNISIEIDKLTEIVLNHMRKRSGRIVGWVPTVMLLEMVAASNDYNK